MLEFDPALLPLPQDFAETAIIASRVEFADDMDNKVKRDDFWDDIVVTGGGGGGFGGFGSGGGFGGSGGDFGGGGSGGAFGVLTSVFNSVDINTLLSTMVDSDGDGTIDSEDSAPADANEGGTIFVESNLTQREALIVDAIATRQTNQFLGEWGFAIGVMGVYGLPEILIAVGVNARLAGGLTGAASATGAVTDLPSALSEVRSAVHDALVLELTRDIDRNPDNYRTWFYNPIDRTVFDGNDRQYNQFD